MEIQKTLFKRNPFKRSVASIVAALYLFMGLLNYAPAAFAKPANLKVQGGSLSKGPRSLTRNETIQIPPELGLINESLHGPSEKTIIYIQDAHDSLEAQENIAKIIRHLVGNYGVKTVYEEGYEGPLLTDDMFGFIKDREIKERISYFLLDNLKIGGAEYAHINRSTDFQLIGADDIALHLENIKRYQAAAKGQQAAKKDLKILQKEIRILGERNFPKEFKRWLRLKERLEENKIPLLEYLTRMAAAFSADSSKGTYDFPQYPNITLLFSTMNAKDDEGLRKAMLINTATLLEEIDAFENEFAGKFLKNDEGYKTYQFYKGLSLLGKLNSLEINSVQFEVVSRGLHTFDSDALVDFIAQQTRKPMALSKGWERNVARALLFYQIAQARDDAIIRSVKEFKNRAGEEVAILVCGGFHKSRVSEALREAGFNVGVVVPAVTSADQRHRTYYKQLMSHGNNLVAIPTLLRHATPPARVFELIRAGVWPRAVFQERLLTLVQNLKRVKETKGKRWGHYATSTTLNSIWGPSLTDLHISGHAVSRSEARRADGAKRGQPPLDGIADAGHQYVEVVGAEKKQILKALVDSALADWKMRIARLIKTYNAGKGSLALVDAVSVKDKRREFNRMLPEVETFRLILKDEEGIYWLVKKRVEGFSEGEGRSIRQREELAYLLLRHTSNQAEIRRITKQDVKHSPELGAIADIIDECYLTRLVADGNVEDDSFPHKNALQANSAIFVANILIRKYDPHLYNLVNLNGVPVSIDNEGIFGFRNDGKKSRFELFEFYFATHLAYPLIGEALDMNQALEGSPNYQMQKIMNEIDYDEAHHSPEEAVNEFISARHGFGFGDSVMTSLMLDEKHIRESLLEHKKIESTREVAVEAGYRGKELDDVEAMMNENLQVLGRDVNEILKAITGRDYGLDKIDAEFSERHARSEMRGNELLADEARGILLSDRETGTSQSLEPMGARVFPRVENKIIFIDFNDLAQNFSDEQIKEVIFIAGNMGRDSRIVLYNLDLTHPLGKLFEKLTAEAVVTERTDFSEAVEKYGEYFSGEIAHISSDALNMSMDKFRRAGMSTNSTFLFGYRGKKSGTLGVGLTEMEHGKLKQQLPFYLDRDARGVIFVRAQHQSLMNSWQELYRSNVAFSRAA